MGPFEKNTPQPKNMSQPRTGHPIHPNQKKMSTFSELFLSIPTGAKEGEWIVPETEACSAVSFLKNRVPSIQYTMIPGLDGTHIRFTSGDCRLR